MSVDSMLIREPHRYLIYAKEALPLFLKACGIKDRYGGYLSGLDHNKQVVFTARVGRVTMNKEPKYRAFSVEKCWRTLDNEQQTSYGSREPEQDRYGGAVRLAVGALGFSGFEELDDEAFSLLLGVMTEDLSLEAARFMAAKENLSFQKLLQMEGSRMALWNIIHECRGSE